MFYDFYWLIMSTLKVGTIANTSGSEGSTPAEINSGRAKAWIAMKGSGTVSILSSYNISSISDGGTGSYRANLSVTLSSSNQCVVGAGSQGTTGNDNIIGHALRSTTQIGLYSAQNTSGALEDCDRMYAAVFGDLA